MKLLNFVVEESPETIPLSSYVMIFWLCGLLYDLEKLPMLPVFWDWEIELSLLEGCSDALALLAF